jgi:ribosomal protein S12 methylthiotransferase accessory factor
MSETSYSLQRLYNVIDLLVDERVGIINYAGEMPREAGAPEFFHFYAKASNTRAFCRQKNFENTGGASAHRGRAMAKAVGEAVERYCAAIYDIDALPLGSYRATSLNCVAPEDFALYSANQYSEPNFPYSPFNEDTLVRWTPALDLETDETCYVPASMVFIPYACTPQVGEVPIVQPISTGLACHCSYEEAAISAICEVIERDAFMIAWQAKLAMPHVRIESISYDNRSLVERFIKTGSQVTILNITMDHGVPTILSVLRSTHEDSPALVFAASAHLDAGEAIRKSLEELAHTRRHAQYLKNTLPPVVPGRDFGNITKQDRHMRLFCQHENAHLAEFIFSSKESVDFECLRNLYSGNPVKDLQTLVSKVGAVNHRVLVADVTTPDVKETGLSVVRALIPGFHPLFMGHRFRALGSRRLREVPPLLGFTPITAVGSDNLVPHPYP